MTNLPSLSRRQALALASVPLLMPRAAFAQSAGPIVETATGKVRGQIDRGVSAFRGIPYGATTGGAGRFRRLKPPAKWAGVRDAIEYGAQCPQVGILATGIYMSSQKAQESSEDCLFLNVWTPRPAGVARPVMVWLHGGGFESGSGSSIWYDGVNLATRGDVVVVTINHRLNVFGFAYLAEFDPSFADSGNAGMLDIIDALKWVRENIAAFGGDPGNVTLFGESGGGRKISVLAAMPEAQGLFHKAIIQSGSALQMRKPEQATNNGRRLLNALGLSPNQIGRIGDVPTKTLLDAGLKASGFTAASLGGANNFVPVVDGRNLLRDPFVPDAPALSASVPMIIGWTRTETSRLIGARDEATLTLDFETLNSKVEQYVPGANAEALIKAFRAEHPNAGASELFFLITTATGVRQEAFAQLDARNKLAGSAPVYGYCLSWRTPVDGGRWMSPHALDVPIVFDNVRHSPSLTGPETPQTKQVVDDMVDAWLAFAKTGSPDTRRLPWPAYTAEFGAVMVFDNPSQPAMRAFDAEKAATEDVPPRRANGG